MLYRGKSITVGGFTIVELIIVVVVIAVLAAITIVSYNGIQARADGARILSDFRTIEKRVLMYRSEKGSFPACPGYVDGVYSECVVTALGAKLGVDNLPGAASNNGFAIDYVSSGNGLNWAVRFMKRDGTMCKAGSPVPEWYDSIPNCLP